MTQEQKNKAIRTAARLGQLEQVNALLAAGADIKAKDINGETALHWASLGGRTKTAQALLAAGADIKAKDKWRKTALHRAAQRGHTETVQVLLSAGADIESKDNDGKTALHWAARWDHAETVQVLERFLLQVLLARGADSLYVTQDVWEQDIQSVSMQLKDKILTLLSGLSVLNSGGAAGGAAAAADHADGALQSKYRKATIYLVRLIKLARRDKKYDGLAEYEAYARDDKDRSWFNLLAYAYGCDQMLLGEQEVSSTAADSAEAGGGAAAASDLESQTGDKDYFSEFLTLLTRLDAFCNAMLKISLFGFSSSSKRQNRLFGVPQTRAFVDQSLSALFRQVLKPLASEKDESCGDSAQAKLLCAAWERISRSRNSSQRRVAGDGAIASSLDQHPVYLCYQAKQAAIKSLPTLVKRPTEYGFAPTNILNIANLPNKSYAAYPNAML
jgi:hypothetical protein